MHAKLAGRWRGLAAVPMDNGTRTQYPQTTATPRPSKFRMQFPHDMDRRTLNNRRISTIRLQYLKYTQGNCMRNYRDAVRTQHHATDPQARRTPEGPDGPVAAPVGGGGAWPGFEATRRAKLAARTARGRAAAHGHTKQPGRHSDQAYRADHAQRTARGRAAAHGHIKQPGPHQAARQTQRPGPPAPGTPASPQPMFHVKHLPIHRPRYPVSPGKWHT